MCRFRLALFVLLILIAGQATTAQTTQRLFATKQTPFARVVGDSSAKAKTEVKVDPWTSADKGQHLLGSMMLTVAAAKSLQKFYSVDSRQAKWNAAAITISVGIGKEISDYFRPGHVCSYKDLLADGLGILLGQIILNIR